MLQEKNSVPQWVRTATVMTGCLSIPLMVLVECFGFPLSPYVTGGVVVFAVANSCFAFDRALPSTISRLLPNKDSD